MHAATCANCGATLVGPYCAECGQHAHESSRAIGVLFHDAWHVLTHVDGRFWQTIGALLFKPGRLTREYFAERRARYVPPVRVYLVLSVLFFALASFGPHPTIMVESTKNLPKRKADTAPLQREAGAAGAEARAAGVPVEGKAGDASVDWDNIHCDTASSDIGWLESAAHNICTRVVADHGRAMARGMISAVPKVLFLFLPFMALVMMLLYWWPRHFYVEHVVFFLHAHAAIFLVLMLDRVVALLALWLPWLAGPSSLFSAVALFYLVWYVYKAMRVYYGQGRLLTLAKLAVVGTVYVLFGALTFAMTAIAVALYG